MNRLLKSVVAPTLRINHAAPSSSVVQFFGARHFSDSTANDADADDGIKVVGTVRQFSFKNAYGFILPDGIDKDKCKNSDLIFIHRNEIKTLDLGPSGERVFPSLNRDDRVQFKIRAANGDNQSKKAAYDLTLEGGKFVNPFNPKYLEIFSRTQKAKFGDEVFDIFSTSADQTELETKIVAAYDRVKSNIERQTEKVSRIGEIYDKNEKKE